jgi:hypothetical protein
MSFNYTFENMGRIGLDSTDNTQRTIANSKYSEYMLSDYNSSLGLSSHVDFATQQPNIMFSGIAHGSGLNGSVVDFDSLLMINKEQSRSLEKLQLFQRPFVTVPYLGRGSCNPDVESQLLHGEMVSDRKSVSTIMEKSMAGYSTYASDDNMVSRVNDPKNWVEESALEGWVRGGINSRYMAGDENLKKEHRPFDKSF